MHREARKAACFAASRFRRHLLVHAMQMRRAACFWRAWDFRPMKPFIHLFIDYMFKSPPTQASSTVTSAQRKVEVQLAKFELAQMKNIELLKQIDHAHKEKYLHQAKSNLHAEHLSEIRSQADVLTKKLTHQNLAELQRPSKYTTSTEFGDIDVRRLAILIKEDPALCQLGNRLYTEQKNSYEESKKIASIESTIDNLSKNKESTQADFDESRMELTQSVDVLHAVKPNAVNTAELDHLLAIAAQKMAAADASTASVTLSLAQKNFDQMHALVYETSARMDELYKEVDFHSNRLNAVQDEFVKSGKYSLTDPNISKFQDDFLSIPEHQSIYRSFGISMTKHQVEFMLLSNAKKQHALANSDLIAATTKVQETAKILGEADSAVAKAKLALEQHIPDNDLTSCIDGAILTDASPAPATDHSQAIEEHHLEEQVVQVGTNNTWDIP